MIAQFLAWLILGEKLSGATLSCTAIATAGTVLVARPAFLFGSEQAIPRNPEQIYRKLAELELAND